MKMKYLRGVLILAALYNLAFGALVVLFPLLPFRWAHLPPPNYPQIWQCLGMVVGVYGVGYGIAALNPVRHWPIVLVGLLGKILGPIGMLWSILTHTLPPQAAWLCAGNDLIWWPAFTAILLHAWKSGALTADLTGND